MDTLFGTKVYDIKKKRSAIVIKTYKLGYVDAPDAMGAQVIDPDGNRYPQNMDCLIPADELTEGQRAEFNLPQSF